jgi:hypothetical protein
MIALLESRGTRYVNAKLEQRDFSRSRAWPFGELDWIARSLSGYWQFKKNKPSPSIHAEGGFIIQCRSKLCVSATCQHQGWRGGAWIVDRDGLSLVGYFRRLIEPGIAPVRECLCAGQEQKAECRTLAHRNVPCSCAEKHLASWFPASVRASHQFALSATGEKSGGRAGSLVCRPSFPPGFRVPQCSALHAT